MGRPPIVNHKLKDWRWAAGAPVFHPFPVVPWSHVRPWRCPVAGTRFVQVFTKINIWYYNLNMWTRCKYWLPRLIILGFALSMVIPVLLVLTDLIIKLLDFARSSK